MTGRRKFLWRVSLATLSFSLAGRVSAADTEKFLTSEERNNLSIIEAHRPSRLAQLPADFNARFGTTHSDGKYYFTDKPFLIEGAEKMLEMGTQLGKFWFSLPAVKQFYSFNSTWPDSKNLVELAETEYFQAVWDMPFKTIMLTTTAPSENGWRRANLNDAYYAKITKDYYDLASWFYQRFRDRPITVILQNWEGDWMLRGIGASWIPVPDDWQERCEQMQRWIAARQAGVNKARAEFGKESRCIVANCVEVNRVADAWKGIPTVTRNVLPAVEVDLVSYSAYDGINSGEPLLFWKCLDEIRQYVRTGPLFGPGALAVGEYGIPENDNPKRIWERYDEMMGVMLAQNVRYAAQWELYCNEFAGKPAVPPQTPVTDPKLMRGFWMVKPDGSLGEAGRYFQEMWRRANEEQKR